MIKKLMVSVILLAAIAGSIYAQTRTTCTKLQNTLGQDTFLAIKNSQQATITQLQPNRKPPFVAISAEMAVSSDVHKQIVNLLLDDKHYIFGRKKRALFIPYVKLVFDGKESATLYVSKSSQEILVKQKDKDVYLNYDPMANDLNSLISHVAQEGK